MGTYVICILLLLFNVSLGITLRTLMNEDDNFSNHPSISEFENQLIRQETPNGIEFSCEELKMVSADDITTNNIGKDNNEGENAFACDGKEIAIDCKERIIKIIYTNYGRKSKDVCSEPGSLKFTSCSSKDSITIVKHTCHNKHSCKIKADVSVFGNPCPKVQKYLEVKYTCEQAKSLFVCDGKVLHIICPENKYINVVAANYGRTNKVTCSSYISLKFILCSAKDSLQKVQERCQGKQTCSVTAGKSEFGEPCRNVPKYLEVKYTCEQAFDGEDMEISPGPPKIVSVSHNSAVISVDPEGNMASSNLYKLEIKFSSKNKWYEVINDQGFDFKATQTLDKLWKGQEYDIRVFLKKIPTNTCIPFTRFKT